LSGHLEAVVGETSVYYVPNDQQRWLGKEREVAEAFWPVGVFLVTEDRFIYDRIKAWQAEGRPLPEWPYKFTFAEMGFGSPGEFDPVPNVVYDLRCPHCDADIGDALRDAWEAVDARTPVPERSVPCAACGQMVRSDSARSDTPFTFAQFYIWVADIDPDDWDPTFKQTVEAVLGPCREYQAWDT
jgi:hypothetical protein